MPEIDTANQNTGKPLYSCWYYCAYVNNNSNNNDDDDDDDNNNNYMTIAWQHKDMNLIFKG